MPTGMERFETYRHIVIDETAAHPRLRAGQYWKIVFFELAKHLQEHPEQLQTYENYVAQAYKTHQRFLRTAIARRMLVITQNAQKAARIGIHDIEHLETRLGRSPDVLSFLRPYAQTQIGLYQLVCGLRPHQTTQRHKRQADRAVLEDAYRPVHIPTSAAWLELQERTPATPVALVSNKSDTLRLVQTMSNERFGIAAHAFYSPADFYDNKPAPLMR